MPTGVYKRTQAQIDTATKNLLQGRSKEPSNWKLEDLPAAVQSSKSWRELRTKLNLSENGCRVTAQKWITKLGLSTEHFTGERSNLLSDAVVFCKNSKHEFRAKDRFYKQTPDVCVGCGLKPIWNGKPLRFHIDHENGDHTDCRKENLRKLCPNCHSQTETYCGRNKKHLRASTAGRH